jgi:predicted Na+-dependent transporter
LGQVAVVGLGLPWLGFGFGCLFSKLCRRERKDIIAIAIETGIQNTGKRCQFNTLKLRRRERKVIPVIAIAIETGSVSDPH